MTFFEKTMLVMLVVIMAASRSTMATVYQVGDSSGWTFNYDYNEWAFFKQFEVGDTLVFNYDPQLHNVRQVDINDYSSCTDINPIASFNSGSDSITLSTPSGDYFFLCGIPGHCASGLKFHIKTSSTRTSIPVTPPPPPRTNTNTNNPNHDHFPTSSRNKPNQTNKPYYSSASTIAYSFNMLFTLFLLAMV